ncbi:MAG: LysR family transcriptional regulator [Ruminococcaceae bacterium]|nr:LysR family transcriptional regulator [Oscillospiraceae bacterium]
MNYQSARIFLAIAEHRSLSAAADALYLSQPSVSSYLGRLEEELGVRLFLRQRGRNGITLTPEGERLLPVARELLSVERHLQEFRDSCKQKVLRIGTSEFTHEKIFSHVMKKLRRMLPGVELQQYTIPVDMGDITTSEQPFDVSLRVYGLIRPASTNYFACTPCFQEPWCILCPADTPLPDRVLSPAELDPAFQVMTMSVHETMLRWQRQHFSENAVLPYQVALTQWSMPAYFRDSHCWSIMGATTAYHLMEQYPGMLTCRSVEPAPLPLTGYIVASKSYSRPDIIRAFIHCCREYVEERPMLECLLPDDISAISI